MITTRCLWYMLPRCLTYFPLVSFVSYGCSLAASFFSILNLVIEFGVRGLTGILFGGFFICVVQVFVQHTYVEIYMAMYTERLQPHFIHNFYSLWWNLPATSYCQGLEKNLNSSLSLFVFLPPGHFFLILVSDCLRMTWPLGSKSFLIVTCPAKRSTCPRLLG